MEKRIIRHRSELPDWYSLAKYKNAESLGTIGWYWQLSARSLLWEFVRWGDVHDRIEVVQDDPGAPKANEWHRKLFALLDSVRREAIVREDDSYNGQNFFGDIIESPSSGIRYATVTDIRDQLLQIRSVKEDAVQRYLSKWDTTEGSPQFGLPLPDLHLHFPREVLVNIRLDVPEALLIKNFAAFIRRAKEECLHLDTDEKNRFRTPDFFEWIRVGLLPYLDLHTWEIEANVSIPNRVMADAIFCDGEGGEEVVRKTTEKLARQILNGSVIKNLAVLYATETQEDAKP